jgi:NAD(P)-dependent dehydrogenase (short-subunit alcohol dehydrogenase family)
MTRALVTGAASGIGRALVARLVSDGHSVVAVDIDSDGLDRAASDDAWPNDAVVRSRLDVRDDAAWEVLLDEVEANGPPIERLFLVAGVLRPGWIVDTTPEDYRWHFDINVGGVVHGARSAARRMVGRKRGHIVIVASLAGVAAIPGIALYSASKFAVRGFGLALRQELDVHGVAVTVVCPDAVETPMLRLQEDYPEAALTFSGGRVLTVGDVVDALAGSVLRQRPAEVLLPLRRGALARVGAAFPSLAAGLERRLRAAGEARQRARRGRGSS